MPDKRSLAKANRMLWLFGWAKIRLIAICRPKIVYLDDDRITIRIRKNFWTTNHLGSMYLGALAIGADLASGFQAFQIARGSGLRVSLAFKKMTADFIQRPESDVYFQARGGEEARQMLEECQRTGERVTRPIPVEAQIKNGNEMVTVAKFEMELSLKVK
ncbi:DUF4442 domain-containing protein [bacterium SCSIO 12741]|nr:DUF4442 domain-containing protein [bacterium SCSIO 12741]